MRVAMGVCRYGLVTEEVGNHPEEPVGLRRVARGVLAQRARPEALRRVEGVRIRVQALDLRLSDGLVRLPEVRDGDQRVQGTGVVEDWVRRVGRADSAADVRRVGEDLLAETVRHDQM